MCLCDGNSFSTSKTLCLRQIFIFIWRAFSIWSELKTIRNSSQALFHNREIAFSTLNFTSKSQSLHNNVRSIDSSTSLQEYYWNYLRIWSVFVWKLAKDKENFRIRWLSKKMKKSFMFRREIFWFTQISKLFAEVSEKKEKLHCPPHQHS